MATAGCRLQSGDSRLPTAHCALGMRSRGEVGDGGGGVDQGRQVHASSYDV